MVEANEHLCLLRSRSSANGIPSSGSVPLTFGHTASAIGNRLLFRHLRDGHPGQWFSTSGSLQGNPIATTDATFVERQLPGHPALPFCPRWW